MAISVNKCNAYGLHLAIFIQSVEATQMTEEQMQAELTYRGLGGTPAISLSTQCPLAKAILALVKLFTDT